MKKILGLFLTVALLFVVTACAGNKNQTLLDNAKNDLTVVFSNGDNATSVTKRVTLVTKGLNETVITWSSSDTTVIANDGSVTRPANGSGDKVVTLTATLMLKDLTVTKAFTLTVKETPKTDAEILEEAKTALVVTFATGDEANSVTSNVTLAGAEGDATVTWSSSNETVLTAAGVVTRPKFGNSNATVVLTATLTLNDETTTKEFILVVKANENILDEDAVADTKGKIIILSGLTETSTHFELPLVGSNSTEITWLSSNPSVIEVTNVPKGAGVKARVIRPDFGADDAVVTLTATISKGGASDTKTFDITVKAYDTQPSPLITIAEAKTKADASLVKVQGVVTALAGNNVYLQDDTAAIYLYLGSSKNEELVIGNEVIIEGEIDIYSNLYEIKNLTVDVLSIGNDLPEVETYYSITKLSSMDLISKIVNLKGVTISEVKTPSKAGSSYSVIITDGSATMELRVDKYTPPYIEPTSFTVGQVVDITGALSIFNSSYQLMIISIDDMTTNTFNDAEKLAAVNDSLALPTQVAGNLTLPTTINGVSVTWSSNNTAVVANDGTVVRPAAGEDNVDVTLTASLTIGTETAVTKDITVTVLALNPITIADAKTKADASIVTIKGIVTEIAGNNAYVQDSTGAIYLYLGATTTFGDKLVIGNEVYVTGEFDINNNLKQLRSISSVKVVTTGNTLPAVKEFSSIAELVDASPMSEIVKLSNLRITKVPAETTGSYSVEVTDGVDTIVIRVDKYTLPFITTSNFVVGNYIDITSPLSVYGSTLQLMIVAVEDMTVLTLTDAEKLAFAKNALSLPTTTTSDVELETTIGDATITWSSNNTAIDAATGTVTRPALGEADVTVTLSATLTVGTVTDTVTFYVIVEAVKPAPTITDLFFSEYIEGGSNNKAIEIYNGTGADVDLSQYTIELYANGSATAGNTITLTGTLANGEVYVIYNSGSVADIINVGDVDSTVTYFNGDDAFVLKHNDVIIDSFGVVGTDPGSYWANADGSIKTVDMTLVRKSTVISGDTNTSDAFDPSVEWIAYDKDTFTYLGSHTTN